MCLEYADQIRLVSDHNKLKVVQMYEHVEI